MKILFCANIYESGIVGPARLAEGLLKINELYKERHELRILTADVGMERLPVYRMSISYPWFLRFFDVLFRGWAFYLGIRRVRREYEFNIILFGNAMYGLVPKFFIKNIPIGGFINDDHTVVVKWNNFLKHEGGLSLFLFSFAERLSTRKLDFIIVCSDYLRNLILVNYRCPEEKGFLLYQAIDIGQISFNPRHFEAKEAIKILFVKYRFRLGGLPDLAEALALLKQFSFQITVIGPPEKDAGEIGTFFNELPHVSLDFRGPVSQAIVHHEMNKHHILCIPSHLEAQGLANVEGLAHGISVVSTWAGGIPEVLDSGRNGWLCDSAKPALLAMALRDCILTGPTERLAKSQRGRKFAEMNSDFPKMLENLLSLLQSQISKHPNAE